MVRFTCGGKRRAHHGESAFWGTFADASLPQVYHAVCDKVLILCELDKMVRFTCGGKRRAHHGESAFWGTFADTRLPQVYYAIFGNALEHR